MRTSEEIYHRVRWDPRLDPARFMVGVEVRAAEPKRVPLPAFVPGGDIPWHRVLFIEADGERVWDRATGVDRVGSSPAGQVRARRLLSAPYFTARTPHAWHEIDGWVPAEPRPGRPATTLRVVTWNTLWDRYDADRIGTARRRPLLIAELEHADADVIALQEVERDLLDRLLATGWVRDRYTLFTDPVGRDVDDSGVLLLSRVPVREAARHRLGRYKQVTAITVDGPVVVAAVHLTSDHAADGPQRRDAELASLAAGLTGLDVPVVVAGDVNDDGDTAARRLGLRDAWIEAHGPGDRTATFDPARNPLAAIGSPARQPARLDRVLLRGEELSVRAAGLLGHVPRHGLLASDHFGVVVDVTIGATPEATAGARPATRTAPAEPMPDPEAPAPAAADTAGIIGVLRDALADGVVHLVGSRRLGCDLRGADLDLVAVLPDVTGVPERVAAAAGDHWSVRPVTGARVPGLRLRGDGLAVDLVTVGTGEIPVAEAVTRRAELGEPSAVALSAVSDAEAVLAATSGAPGFRGLARAVKAWARLQGLDSAPFGGLPGLAWTVLAARTALDAGDLPPADLLRHFCGAWAAWNWAEPVTLTGVATVPATAYPLTVLTPSAPVRSCTTQVTAGIRDLLTEELYQSWEGRPATPPHRRHRAWTVLTVRPVPGEPFAETVGRFRGRVRALLTALDEAGVTDAQAWPRPFATGPDLHEYAVGLGRRPPTATALNAILSGGLTALPGVHLTHTSTAPALR
ncbi:poly(A) polymerase [Actinoplanes utahensis]|uniref:Endonuclease/exonuclease/phosphatase n=1 Tax=Actinoplanes utahensis TaxID=1869 RepID=A0A0A6UMA8_ACTUT|nr:poly(A) polymerase [Actinoplanes utahensis]KHD77265.1 endonuclease/exonuclease/phosphatase [Actinoplanes utahensis]GIF33474.1 hypothetical protein Aut01nite_64600 [Actinoplanes utahensis]